MRSILTEKIKFNAAKLTEMRAFTRLRYGEKEEVFNAFMEHLEETNKIVIEEGEKITNVVDKITTASYKLIKIIDTSIGIDAFNELIAGRKNSGRSRTFTSLLVDAVLDGTSANEDKHADDNNPVYERIKEVILMRVLLDGIHGFPPEAARQVGHTCLPKYGYEAHLRGNITFDAAKLTEMRTFTLLRYSEKEEVFDAFIEHVTRTKNLDVKKITTASDKLIDIIKTSIGIKKLDALLKGNTKAGDFTQLLTKASLEGKPVERIKKVIVTRKLIAAIQTLTGKGVDKAVRSLGNVRNYSYSAHLGVGYDDSGTTKEIAKKKAEAEEISKEFSAKIREALDNGDMKGYVSELANTYGVSKDDLQQAKATLSELTEDGKSIADFEEALQKEKKKLRKKKINQEDLNNKINAYAEAIKILEQKQAVDDMQAALKRLQKMDTEQPNTPKEVITPPATEKYKQIYMFDFEKFAG